jgi:hypothetical protein
MPCNSITTQTVALKNAIPEIVRKALEADGWTIRESTAADIVAYRRSASVQWVKGTGLTVAGRRQTGNEQIANDITREYSKQAVTWAASRAGWQVQNTGGNTLTVQRR